MTGITSAGSKAAQSGALQVVTSDSAGNLATSTPAGLGIATSAEIAAINSHLNSDIGAINSRLNELDGRTDKALQGVAMAFAMAGVPTVLPHETIAMTANWGNFEGKDALSVAGAVKLNQFLQVNAGVGVGVTDNVVGARAGVRIGW